MPGRMRSIASSRSGLGLTLVLLLLGLLLSITGCESLASDTSASTETSTQTTVAEAADSAEPFFGSWQGTYTTFEVRDQNGVVADPPVPLNTPLAMHLELHAWSETSGDCGTLTVAGYPNGRVLELSVEGQVARLSIVNEEEGLENSRSLMTLTLQGDTLTGADEPDPDVPEGWYVTTGSVYLARTLSAATTDVTAEESPESAESSPEGEEGEEAPALTEPEPIYWEWGNSDDGEQHQVHVGDHIRVRLDIPPAFECASIEWRTQEEGNELHNLGEAIAREGGFVVRAVKNYEVIGAGQARIIGVHHVADGSLIEWFVDVIVAE